MRLVELEIKGYRSIRHVHLQDLGSAVVLYGENGAGKSNVLAAIALWWEMVGEWARAELPKGKALEGGTPSGEPHSWGTARVLKVVDSHQQRQRSAATVSGTLLLTGYPPSRARRQVPLTVRVKVTCALSTVGSVVFWGDPEVLPSPGAEGGVPSAGEPPPSSRALVQFVRAQLADSPERPPWLHVPALRGLAEPARTDSAPAPAAERAARLALQGRFAEAAFVAQSSPDLDLAERLGSLQALLTSAPLNRPPFRAVQNDDGSHALQEIQKHGDKRIGVPLDLAGLGVQQVYAILGAMVLSKARVIAIEEPEAHLHERTMGRDLRAVLRNALDTGVVDQLFIATHSALFDLDADAWYEVTLDEDRCTTVTRRTDRADLDRRHLYETGPARNALMDVLRGVEGDRVMYRRGDGSPFTASELLRALQEHDPVAVEYLDTLVEVAVRTIGVGARRSA